MPNVMQLDASSLDGYRERFLRRMPDFADFTLRTGRYWDEEREYKEEISAMCMELLPSTLFESRKESLGEDVFQAVRKILTGKLKTINRPQNIVGWRDASFCG
jgi:hypothetical protein